MLWIPLLACSPPAPLRVEVDGCEALARSRCALPPGRALTLWVAGEAAPTAPETDWAPVDGGFRGTVTPTGSTLAVRAGRGRFALAIVPWPRAAEIDQAQALAKDGRRDEALALLRANVPPDPERAAERIVAAAILSDEVDDGAPAALAASGAPWHAARLALLYAYRAWIGGTTDALRWVEVARGYLGAEALPTDLAWSADYLEGLAHQSLGDHRQAILVLDRAEQRAVRAGLAARAAEAERVKIGSLVRSGQSEAIARLGARVAAGPPDPDPCGQAQVLNAYAWGLIQLAEAGLPPTADAPGPLLERALALLDGATCGPAHDRDAYAAQVHLNLALVALAAGDPDAAATHLGAARAVAPRLREPWSREIAGRIALARGDTDGALAAWRSLRAEAGERLELAWMARRGEGLALAAAGRRSEAIAALADAQALFFREGLLVPVHLGRAAYLVQRDGATAHLAELLLADGRPREAFDALRNQRAQYLVGLHQTTRLETDRPPGWEEAIAGFRAEQRAADALPAAWDLPLDQRGRVTEERAEHEAEALRWFDAGGAALGVRVDLQRRRPEDGEVLLGWFPATHGWLGFGERAGRVVVHRWDQLPSDAELLAPFAELIRGADRITLLPHADLADHDLHALLVDAGDVRYGLDLVATAPADGGAATLVVSDPGENLRAAAAEGEVIRAALGARPLVLLAGSAATGSATRAALEQADFLHFSGHAVADGGWGSHLALAGGDRLDVASVLALPRVPRVVVLNACETGREAGPGSLGIAQAFVVAGAEQVVATSRPIDDAVALAFAEGFYRDADRPLAERYREAVRALRARDPAVDWSAYRRVVR